MSYNNTKYSNNNKNYYNRKQNSSNYNDQQNDIICDECVETHDQKYNRNYEWLDVLGYGPVELVWFTEPANSNEFVLYTTKWWETHCKVVSHGNNLYQAHYDAFVNPKTRFARMIFLFQDGTLKEADSEFYRLEQEYYDKKGLCNY